jgi:hypothetical protein
VGRIVEAKPRYTDPADPADPRHVLHRSGPAYPHAAAYLYLAFGYGFFGGRVLSLLATCGCAILIISLLRRYGAGDLAFLGGAFFLLSRDLMSYGTLHRPETVGLCFGLLCFSLAGRNDRFRHAAPLAAFMAAAATPLSLAGVCAAACASFRRSRHDGLYFAVPTAAACLLGLGAAQAASGGFFLTHVLPHGEYWVSDLWDRYGSGVALRYAPALLLAGVGAVHAVRSRAGPLLAFACVALLAGLRAGYETEDGGVRVEAVAGISLLFVLGLRHGLAAAKLSQPIAGLAIAQGVLLAAAAGHDFFPIRLRDEIHRRDATVAGLVGGTSDFVLSDNPCYPALQPRGLFLDPRTYRVLVRTAQVDERDLLRRIREGAFTRAVLEYELRGLDPAAATARTAPDRLSRIAADTVRRRLPIHKTFTVKLGPARRLVTEVRSTVPEEMPR